MVSRKMVMFFVLFPLASLAIFLALKMLVRKNFYPIVSKEVEEYRERDKKQNLGVREPTFYKLYRNFAGVKE